MGLRTIVAMAFVHELEKIGSDLKLPLNGVAVKEAESVIEQSFLEGLLKVAKPRYAREAMNAAQAGDMDTLNQISGAHERLGLKGREAGALGGGAEAGAFLNLGRAPGQMGGPNHHVEKFYNPESGITRGDYTRQLMEQKQKFTDTARSISPEARAMVPDMYGHESKNIGTPTQRTRSSHEFVGGMHSLRKLDNRGELLDQVEKHVISPMKARGMSMGDTMREAENATGNVEQRVNTGNVVNSPTGPKVVDFLPHEQGQQYLPGQSMGHYDPNLHKDNVDMAPRQAKAEFYNPKSQIHAADAEGQAKAKANWQRGGMVPDFEVNAVPFNQRQKQQQALAHAPTVRPNVPAAPPAAPASMQSTPTALQGPARVGALQPPPAAPGALAPSAAMHAPTAQLGRPRPMSVPKMPSIPVLHH